MAANRRNVLNAAAPRDFARWRSMSSAVMEPKTSHRSRAREIRTFSRRSPPWDGSRSQSGIESCR